MITPHKGLISQQPYTKLSMRQALEVGTVLKGADLPKGILDKLGKKDIG